MTRWRRFHCDDLVGRGRTGGGWDWLCYLVTAGTGLVGAGIGAVAAWKGSRDVQRDEWARLRQAGLEDTRRAESQYRRELLAKAADQLLDALWVKERELCDALHVARVAARDGITVTPEDEAGLTWPSTRT